MSIDYSHRDNQSVESFSHCECLNKLLKLTMKKLNKLKMTNEIK